MTEPTNVWIIRKETAIAIHPEPVTIRVLQNATLPATGTSEQWQIVMGNSQLISGAYAVDSLTLTILALPAIAALGQKIKIYGLGAGGWRIAQSDGQSIKVGNKKTTPGISGNILSVEQGDYLELVYLNGWVCTEIFGNVAIS